MWFIKHFLGFKVGEMTKTVPTESLLVDTLLSTMINKDDVSSTAHSFLEANSGVEACQQMLENWERFVINNFFLFFNK